MEVSPPVRRRPVADPHRWPNFDPQDPYRGGWAKAEGAAEPDSQQAFRYKEGSLPRHWAKPTEGEVNIYYGNFGWHWANDIIPIKRIDETKRIITLLRPTRDFDRPSWFWPTPFQNDALFVVENVLEELDQPGEWCLDSEEGKLYFWPPGNAMRPEMEVVAPALDRLVALHRTQFVTFRGFTLTETTDGDEPHPGGVEGPGPCLPRKESSIPARRMHLNRAEWCVVEDNYFNAVGGNGIYLQGYNVRNIVRRNEIAHTGAAGVAFGGQTGYGDFLNEKGRLSKIGREGMTLANSHPEYPMFNEIVDNDIHHCGEINYLTAGIFAALSEDNVIGHNWIHEVSHHAINLGSSGQSRNIIEYNLIQRTCLRTGDTGAINCWGDAQPRSAARQGHIIRYNGIAEPQGHGIYLDDYTSNCFVYGNVIIRPTEVGIYIHGGKNNVLENNLIVGTRTPSAISTQ